MVRLLALLLSLALPTTAMAAPVDIQVKGADGRPLAGAIVVVALPGVPAEPPRASYEMAQRNISFEPHILIVPVGATVRFPNQDKVRHHVYSFSKAKKFDLKLYGRDETRSVVFEKPGAVALGCNIHDQMNGVIYVAASPYAAVTDADGRVRFATAKTGAAQVTVWHPSIRGTDNQLTSVVVIAPGGYTTTLTVRR